MTKQMAIRNAGTPAEYYTLTIRDASGKVIRVHTSTNYAYICRLSR